jgi:hypothetical protein
MAGFGLADIGIVRIRAQDGRADIGNGAGTVPFGSAPAGVDDSNWPGVEFIRAGKISRPPALKNAGVFFALKTVALFLERWNKSVKYKL